MNHLLINTQAFYIVFLTIIIGIFYILLVVISHEKGNKAYGNIIDKKIVTYRCGDQLADVAHKYMVTVLQYTGNRHITRISSRIVEVSCGLYHATDIGDFIDDGELISPVKLVKVSNDSAIYFEDYEGNLIEIGGPLFNELKEQAQ